MKTSQFEAKTLGVGELITQRKLFRVPPHQRSYAWENDSVQMFLDDISNAFTTKANEYFIGLVVIQGPEEGEWVLLDGQQRLTTTTLVFAAIRNWLWANNLTEDSKQIHAEYLGVRRLGGDFSSRMLMNSENQVAFESAALKETSADLLRSSVKQYGKRLSNRLIIEAAINCQEFVDSVAASIDGPAEGKARRLFDLALFLDSRVKVVCVEVSNDVDAYILFESLNDRAVELSALDLIKNYVFSKAPKDDMSIFTASWQELATSIEDRNPDDFLKVFWTSRNGIIQKAQIFRKLRQVYDSSDAVSRLLRELNEDAQLLAMIEEEEHPNWTKWPKDTPHQIVLLREMNARQTRPVLLAGLRHLDKPVLTELIWLLTVSIIRFQIIGRGRTGVVEKVLGRLCTMISTGQINSDIDVKSALSELYLPDLDFIKGFATHQEARFNRVAYFLASINIVASNPTLATGVELVRSGSAIRRLMSDHQLVQLTPSPQHSGGDDFGLEHIGNFVLVDHNTHHALDRSSSPSTTDISRRSRELAHQANTIWRHDKSAH